MTSLNIPVALAGCAWFTGLHAATAKVTNICDAKTAAVYAVANNASQVLYAILVPPASHFAITVGGALVVGYLGGNLATKALCQREITLKEGCILTAGSVIQGAIYGGILGGLGAWMLDNQLAAVPVNATL